MPQDNGVYDYTSSNRTTGSRPDSILDAARKSRQLKKNKKAANTRDRLSEFMNADIQDSEMGIIPEGYGGITYLAFFLLAPWVAGTLFLFFYVSNGSIEAFSSLESNGLLTWVIGYEILAVLILLLIFKKLIFYVIK